MRKPKRRRLFVACISVLGLAVTIFGHGCGEFDGNQSGLSSLSSSCGLDGSDKIEVIDGEKTVSLVYGRQVLDNMVACTGIGEPSQTTVDEWQARSNSLSEYGYATEVSAPMLMGIAAVAGEVCGDLIEKESILDANARSFFSGVDLDANQLSGADLENALALFSVACWQRNETDEERTMILNTINDIAGDGNQSALSLCTSMLSSLSAISN